MNLKDLIKIANKGYSDDLIIEYFEDPVRPSEDGLAEFIVNELTDTFDPESPDEMQLHEAVRVMEMACVDIEGVINSLYLRWCTSHLPPISGDWTDEEDPDETD